jgi:phage-related protein
MKFAIGTLHERVSAIFTGVQNTVSSYVNEQGIEVRRLSPPPIPDALNVEVGNIIQNLRAPLDKALSAIALQSYPTPKGVR